MEQPATSSTAMASTTPGTVSGSGSDAEHQSKLRTLLGILRRFIGVSDIASVRFSLPSQLLEPIPNLEYWNYVDRPETFASMGDAEDELGRFLSVLRFWFTKDLKYVKGKPCKPYNSTLGEFFRCSWDVQETLQPPVSESRPSSRRSKLTPSGASASSAGTAEAGKLRISYLTEQTSHHPPVSAFYMECPKKNITARGYDQLSAKFTGTSIKVTPGVHNLGIFVELGNHGESYRLTHPSANLGGFLRGSLIVYVEDYCIITCPKTRLKCILQYIGDGWIGKPKHRVEGVIYEYDEETDNIDRIKDVPPKSVRARIEGSWMTQIYYTLPDSKEKYLLIDLDPLFPAPKTIPPPEMQLPNESQRMWNGVSAAIHAKDYSRATKLKQDIEEHQREKAAARVKNNSEWKPRFFESQATVLGRPSLSEEGKRVLQGLNAGDYRLEEYDLN